MPILNSDSSSSKKGTSSAPTEDTSRETKSTGKGVPALPFLERIESWLEEAGPREQLFAVALDVMLTRKETIKKITGRDVYKEMIHKYQDTICRVAGGSETLEKGNPDDEAMAAALAALVAFG